MRQSAFAQLLNLCRPYKAEVTVREFNELYYDGLDGKHLYETTSWLGVKALKCPLDMWIYQEILFKTKSDIVIETGVYCGGSTLYLATICDVLGIGRVLACDITLANVDPKVAAHPRIKLFEGSSVDPEIVRSISDTSKDKRTMVILDSDHSERHVLEELKMYSPLVSVGCYLIAKIQMLTATRCLGLMVLVLTRQSNGSCTTMTCGKSITNASVCSLHSIPVDTFFELNKTSPTTVV